MSVSFRQPIYKGSCVIPIVPLCNVQKGKKLWAWTQVSDHRSEARCPLSYITQISPRHLHMFISFSARRPPVCISSVPHCMTNRKRHRTCFPAAVSHTLYFQWHWQVQTASNDNSSTPGDIFIIIYFAKLKVLYGFFSSTVDILSTVIYILQYHSFALH